jgi:hypothetical protein
MHLNEQYQRRYQKITSHKSYEMIMLIPELDATEYVGQEFTQPVSCMKPEFIISDDSMVNYKNYYIKAKSGFATWKNQVPEWYEKQDPYM